MKQQHMIHYRSYSTLISALVSNVSNNNYCSLQAFTQFNISFKKRK